MKGVRKKLVRLIFASILLLICVPFCCSSVRTCLGLRRPEEVTGKDSAALRLGNVVSVGYECVFEEVLNTGFMYKTNNFEILKLYGKDEYIYAVTNEIGHVYWEDKNFFRQRNKMDGFQAKEKRLFVGKVCRIWDYEAEALKHNVLVSEKTEYKKPNTLENTNFEYSVLLIDSAEEKEKLIKRITSLCLILLFWAFSLRRLLEETKAIDFLREEEKKEQEIQRRLELRKQLKQQKTISDDEFWNREVPKEKGEERESSSSNS